MNAQVHAELSVKRYKGKPSDYYAIHDFIDSSKEIESSNKHRLYYHSIYALKQVVIPIFGHTIRNSDGVDVNVKDMVEFFLIQFFGEVSNSQNLNIPLTLSKKSIVVPFSCSVITMRY